MQSNAPEKLRETLKGDGVIVAPGAYDSLCARIIENLNFKAVYMTSYGVSGSRLGKPDIGLLSLSEMVESAHAIAESVNLPLIADAETGYGNALNVIRAVRAYESAGAAAIHIDDEQFPSNCPWLIKGPRNSIISAEEMAGKVRAAVEARRRGLLIFVRSDTLNSQYDKGGSTHMEEAIRRVNMYVDAGADGVLCGGARSKEEREYFAKSIKAPIKLTTYEPFHDISLTLADFRRMGYKIVIPATTPIYAAANGVMNTLRLLKEKETMASISQNLMPHETFCDIVGVPEVRAEGEKYLSSSYTRGRSDQS